MHVSVFWKKIYRAALCLVNVLLNDGVYIFFLCCFRFVFSNHDFVFLFCFAVSIFFSVRSFFGKQFSRKERKRRRRWQQPHNVITSFICFFYTLVCYSILLIWTKKQTPHRSPLNCALWLQGEKKTHTAFCIRGIPFLVQFSMQHCSC